MAKLVADFHRRVSTAPAGKYVRQYLTDLEKEAVARQTHCNWNSTPLSLTYLNLGFINHAQQLFDQAEKAVGSDATLLRRVRHARLPLDRASLIVHTRLTSDWLALGKPAGQAPPDRDAIARRVLDTWLAQAKLRLPESAQETEKQNAEAEMRRYATLPTSVAAAGEVPRPAEGHGARLHRHHDEELGGRRQGGQGPARPRPASPTSST